MGHRLLKQIAANLLKQQKHRQWRKAVSVMACIVIFCTTYALILPAITMEAETYCKKEEHSHSESCYGQEIICTEEDAEGHVHDEKCYRQVLVCGMQEHIHDQTCYVDKTADNGSSEDTDKAADIPIPEDADKAADTPIPEDADKAADTPIPEDTDKTTNIRTSEDEEETSEKTEGKINGEITLPMSDEESNTSDGGYLRLNMRNVCLRKRRR